MPVRQLFPGDEEVLRTLRLKALLDSPAEFTSTYEREAVRTTREWQEWFASGATFVFDDPSGAPVGLVAAVLDDDSADVVWLMAMWVDPAARRSGTAGALVRRVLAWAHAHGARAVRLDVMEHNTAARCLYEHHGFRPIGRVERDGKVEIGMERPASGQPEWSG